MPEVNLDGVPDLDEIFYSLDSEELDFFLTETRIDNESNLKTHIMDVQAKAYKVSLMVIWLLPLVTSLSSDLSIYLHTAI